MFLWAMFLEWRNPTAEQMFFMILAVANSVKPTILLKITVFQKAHISDKWIEQPASTQKLLHEVEFLFVFENIDNSANAWMI